LEKTSIVIHKKTDARSPAILHTIHDNVSMVTKYTTECGKNSYKLSQHSVIEGSLEVKLPTIWTDEKQSREEAERRERSEEEKSRDSLCFSNDLWLRRVEK